MEDICLISELYNLWYHSGTTVDTFIAVENIVFSSYILATSQIKSNVKNKVLPIAQYMPLQKLVRRRRVVNYFFFLNRRQFDSNLIKDNIALDWLRNKSDKRQNRSALNVTRHQYIYNAVFCRSRSIIPATKNA